MFDRLRILMWLGCLAAAGSAPALRAAAPADEAAVRREFSRLLTELDSDRYGVRSQAAARAEELLRQESLGPVLAEEVQRALLQPQVSFEVRWRLERWRKQLPKSEPAPAENVAPEEIARLIAQLDDNDYGVRLGALERLSWMLRTPRHIGPLLAALKAQLATTTLTPDVAARYEKAWESAHRAWLTCDAAQRDLSPLTDAAIGAWVAQLAVPCRAEELVAASAPQRVAQRELLDALARDADVPRIAAMLHGKLAGRLESAAAGRLQALFDLTRPAMVAEYWSSRHHLGEQHLLIGVPSQSPGARRPSHFDRIDDRVAHCVSGHSLAPGDYPSNVAFPHPENEGAFFHLVNLPTPRRRMAYAYQVQTDEARRLAAISRRTLDRFLTEKRLLTEAELVMLAQLDAKEVSRFTGQFWKLVDDRPLEGPMLRERLGGRPSHHGMLCGQLAVDGTKEAAAGLMEAIEKDRFLPPTSLAPYRMQWLAALSIACRDPWPDVDAWLASQVDRTEMLAEDERPDGPEVGATVAGVLLKRHGEAPANFGLQPAPDALLLQLELEGRRYTAPQSRRQVQQWWRHEADKGKGL